MLNAVIVNSIRISLSLVIFRFLERSNSFDSSEMSSQLNFNFVQLWHVMRNFLLFYFPDLKMLIVLNAKLTNVTRKVDVFFSITAEE